jgi:hypothetical protein
MEEPAIQQLEDATQEYAKVRDRRMALTDKEVELKMELRDLMKANQKTFYKHGKIEIEIVPKDEKIKVRIADEEE